MTDLQTQVQQHVRFGKSFSAFATEVLGYHDLLPDHEQVCDFLQAEGHLKLILMPRYTFKSCLCTIGYALWRLVKDDSLRVLIYSDTSTKAENFLTSIKNHVFGLEKHSTFREVYGPWEVDPKQGVWNQSQILIKPRQFAHAEPSIDTAGIETSKVGMHYDLIIFDDIVSDANVTTPEQMQKVKDCYRKALSLLRPGGDVVMTGTRWHFGDLYGQLVASPPHGLQTFIRKAEVDGRYPFSAIGLTREFCQQQKDQQGSYVFSALYQNDPTDDATAIFKAKDFAFYTLPPAGEARDRFRESLYVSCAIDPAISQAQDADDSALTVVGTDSKGTLHLLDIIAGHLLPHQVVDALFDLHARWRLDIVGIETNAFQKMLKRDIEVRFEQERMTQGFRMFSLVEFTGTSATNKGLRIRGLQPYHERGAMRFPGERLETLSAQWSTLAFQMLQFPNSAHDDHLDSLAYHLSMLRKGHAEVPEDALPRTSAKWFEKEVWYKQMVKEQRRLPRWKRQPIPTMAFN